MAKKLSLKGADYDQIPMFTPETDWVVPMELPDLSNVREIAEDTETRDDGLAAGLGPGWHSKSGYIAGMGFSWDGGRERLYVPLRHPDTENYDRGNFIRWLTKLRRQNGTRFVYHNFSYDCGWVQSDLGVAPPENADDTGAMAAIVDENRRGTSAHPKPYALDALCAWRGVPLKDEALLRDAAASYGFPKAIKENLWRLPARFVGPYGEGDPASTLALAHSLRPVIEEEGMSAAYQLEADLLPMILEMRRRGIRVDCEKAELLAVDFQKRRDVALKDLSDRLGYRVSLENVRSNSWQTQAFDNQKLVYPRTDPSDRFTEGQASFEATWMRKHPHWLPQLISRAKQLEDMATKFLRTYIIGFAHRGRVHASINQFRSEGGGTRSHRLSYSDPPLQQIPSRDDELAPLIRGVFLPEPGEIWGALDYSQQEYRLIVHFAEKLKLRKASVAADMYRNDPATDFHELVVSLTGLIRRTAKDCNFAKAFGAGVPKFAAMTGMTEDAAAAAMDQYDEELPFVKDMNEKCQKLADSRGFIRMIDGARAHFDAWSPGWRSFEALRKENDWLRANPKGRGVYPCTREEALGRVADANHPWYKERLRRADTRKAMNREIQGSAARQTKLAMRGCWREGIVPLIQMHDEQSFSFTEEKTARRAHDIMRDVVQLNVPVMVDVEFGITWGKASKVKTKEGKIIYGATWKEAVAELGK